MDVVERAERWLADDPDPATRRELKELLDRNDLVALHERFDPSFAFGATSFRGELGPGPNRMNRVTVIRATAGLCAWLRRQLPNAVERGICVGFDARRMSRELATDAAGVIAGAGFQVWMVDGEMPTPVLAFSVLETGAAAGVMVLPTTTATKCFGETVRRSSPRTTRASCKRPPGSTALLTYPGGRATKRSLKDACKP